MTTDPPTPDQFHDGLRKWAKNSTSKPLEDLAAAIGIGRSRIYELLTITAGAELIGRGRLDDLVRACAPEDLVGDELEEWNRRNLSHWRAKWRLVSEAHPPQAKKTEPVSPEVPGNLVNTIAKPSESEVGLAAEVAAAIGRLGIRAAYVPHAGENGILPTSVNVRRNARKLEVLEEAAHLQSKVRLLAETGNSFLHVRGPFNSAVGALLEAGGRLEVVLMSPDEHLRGSQDELRLKFKQSLRGLLELQRDYSDQIDLKILRARVTATLLISETTSFFEPYIHAHDAERERLLLNTFELEFGKESKMFATLVSNFKLHFKQAEPPRRWLSGT